MAARSDPIEVRRATAQYSCASRWTVLAVSLFGASTIDVKVIETIVARSYATLPAGTYGLRAREGGQS